MNKKLEVIKLAGMSPIMIPEDEKTKVYFICSKCHKRHLATILAMFKRKTRCCEGGKKKKQKISLILRKQVWATYIGMSIGSVGCPICLGATKISQLDFEAGHVIAEDNGGPTIVENLRPICSTCNKSMGTINMDPILWRENLYRINILEKPSFTEYKDANIIIKQHQSVKLDYNDIDSKSIERIPKKINFMEFITEYKLRLYHYELDKFTVVSSIINVLKDPIYIILSPTDNENVELFKLLSLQKYHFIDYHLSSQNKKYYKLIDIINFMMTIKLIDISDFTYSPPSTIEGVTCLFKFMKFW